MLGDTSAPPNSAAAPNDEEILRMLGLHPEQLGQGARGFDAGTDPLRAAHGEPEPPQPGTMPRPMGSTGAVASRGAAGLDSLSPAMAPPAVAGPRPMTINRSPWSQGEQHISERHPFWGGLLKGLDVAGSIVLPNTMRMIPGTRLNEGARRSDEALEVKNQAEADREAAQTEEARARTGLTRAQTENALNPKDKQGLTPEETTIHDLMTGDNGQPRVNPDTQKPYTYLEAYQAIKKAGEKPTTPNQEQNKLQFQGVIGKLDAAGLPSGPKQIDASLDAALKRGIITNAEHALARSYQAANPTPATNLQVTVAGAQQKQGFEHTEAQEKETYKRYETAQDAEQRLSRMEASYKKALKGDQQAMLALLTDHIGMTLGLQKGARITKDILNEATASMPWLEKIESKFDSRGYLSGVTLGPEQMAQMLDLGYEARDRSVQGAHDSSELYGVQPPPGAEKVFGKRQMGAKPALQQGGSSEPTRPANVPGNYVYNAHGPKGAGWYRPTSAPNQ